MNKINRTVVKKTNQATKKNNAAFEKMSPAEKRVSIARDVLAQLASKRLTAKTGYWLTAANSNNLFGQKDLKEDPELQSILNKIQKCEGCALGGMFMCAVQKADDLKLSELEGIKDYTYNKKNGDDFLSNDHLSIQIEDTVKYMRKFFSLNQLNMIEEAFEIGSGALTSNNEYARDFVYEVEDPSERMRLIMENIIKNKGTFRPDQKPVPSWQTPGFPG